MPTEEQEAARAGAGQGALAGAGTGASVGAAAGSIVPGLGTVVGAGIGAVAGAVAGGLLGAKRAKDAYNEAEAAKAKRDKLARQATYEQMSSMIGGDVAVRAGVSSTRGMAACSAADTGRYRVAYPRRK